MTNPYAANTDTPSPAPKYGPQSAAQPTRLMQPTQLVQHPNSQQMVPAQPKSMVAALILCVLFGGLGIHNFYLGQTSKGIWHLVLAALTIIPVLGWIVLAFHVCLIFVQFFLIATHSGDYGKALRGVR